LADPEPTHFVFTPQCLFCGKNSRPRNSRKGRYWRCRKCGEMNPGPGMIKAMVGRFTNPPANGKHAKAAPAAQPVAATVAVATTIKGAPAAPTTKPVSPSKPAAAKTRPSPVKPAAPEKKPSWFEKALYG